MTLNHGIPSVSIPGPSILPDRVREVIGRPMPNIYAGPLLETSDRVLERLPGVVGTSGHGFIVTGNGHAGWQMIIDNTLRPGDKILVLESGRFATIWGEYAAAAGVEVEVLPGGFRDPVDPTAVQQRLSEDDGSIAALLVAHTDTSSSVRNDIAAIRAAVDAADHQALLMVDGIASIGAERFEMDNWGVDVALAASQKGLMCPPGVAFVWANDRAIERYRSLDPALPRSAYFDWSNRLAPRGFYDTYAGTPPVLHLRAIDVALDLIDEEGGFDAVWSRHEALAGAVRAAVDAWSTPDGVEFNITSPDHRSNAVTTVLTGQIDSDELMRRCRDDLGVTLGIGVARSPGGSFRIGHMGHLNPPMILGTLATIETALRQMAAPIGASGVAAATVALARRRTADARPVT